MMLDYLNGAYICRIEMPITSYLENCTVRRSGYLDELWTLSAILSKKVLCSLAGNVTHKFTKTK